MAEVAVDAEVVVVAAVDEVAKARSAGGLAVLTAAIAEEAVAAVAAVAAHESASAGGHSMGSCFGNVLYCIGGNSTTEC